MRGWWVRHGVLWGKGELVEVLEDGTGSGEDGDMRLIQPVGLN